MLFMVIECFRPGKTVDVYRRLRDEGRNLPEGLRFISSWVDLSLRRCFQVMEAQDEALLKEWTEAWDDLVEFEIVPVMTSEKAAEAISSKL